MPLRHIFIIALCLLFILACQRIELPNDGFTGGNEQTEVSSDSYGVNTMSHVILLADTVSKEKVDVMYISLYEWSDIASSFSLDNGADAGVIASEYVEGDLTGWHIPSLDEVRRIKAYYDGMTTRMSDLNHRLEACNAKPVCLADASGKTYRYLCSDGDSTFSFRKGYYTLKAGATVKYNLRLVKDTVMTLVPEEIEFEY